MKKAHALMEYQGKIANMLIRKCVENTFNMALDNHEDASAEKIATFSIPSCAFTH